MKKNLFLVSAMVVATLASCSKESELDPTVVDAMGAQIPIEFSTYASAASTTTKGTPVNTNAAFQSVGSFDVAAIVNSSTKPALIYTPVDPNNNKGNYVDFTMYPTGNSTKYFGISPVTYSSTNSKWENEKKMYWPNYSRVLHFAAYSPSGLIQDESNYTFSYETGKVDDKYSYSFNYTVTDEIDKQEDLMYAMTSVKYLAPSDRYRLNAKDSYVTTGVGDINDDNLSVNLHFKHALTQIAFTATKDAALDVYVKSITLCNVYNSGKFTATKVTNDDDKSTGATDSETVGDTGQDGDKVNANNFGSWETTFNGGWNELESEGGSDKYYAKVGSKGLAGISNYEATLVGYSATSPSGSASNAIAIGNSGVTQLTENSEVLMLIPQKLTKWIPSSYTTLNYVGTSSSMTSLTNVPNNKLESGLDDGNHAISTANSSQTYLAIDCEIYHTDATDAIAKIHDGYLFVPFETKDIDYSKANVDTPTQGLHDKWLPGYKITYCLNFGGGYIVEEGNHDKIPEPGCTPDTETYTLRTVTYTTTCDTWVDRDKDPIDQELGDHDTSK